MEPHTDAPIPHRGTHRRHAPIPYDRELLLCASFLHDAGLYGPASTGDVYIKDSARYARRTLEPFGWPDERMRACLDACEQHHAFTTRWWMPNEVELVRRSDLVEVLPELVRFGIPRSWLKRELWHAVPRTGFWPATLDSPGALAADAAGHVPPPGAGRDVGGRVATMWGIHLDGLECADRRSPSRKALPALVGRVPGLVSGRRRLPGLPGVVALAGGVRVRGLRACGRLANG